MRRLMPRPVDIAAAAVFTAGTQAEVWTGFVPGPSRMLLALTYLVGTVAVAWHRIAPITVLVVVLTSLAVVPAALGVEDNAGLSWFIAAFAVIVSAGYHARRPLVALAVTLGLLAATVILATGLVIADVVYAWLLGAGCWLAGRTIATRTLRAELSEQRAALAQQRAQWQAAVAVSDERLRIARELHDVIGHSISIMTLHVGGVRRLLEPDQVEQRAALAAVEQTGRDTLAEAQRLLGVLRAEQSEQSEQSEQFDQSEQAEQAEQAEKAERPEQAAPAPGLARVADLLEPARVAGIRVAFVTTGEVRPLPVGLDMAAYRIVQEAVTNVLRHAAASRIDCTVHYGSAAVDLRVVDDGAGRGGNGPVRHGHGHIGMRERASVYGGTVDMGPRPGGGYAVHAVLPLPRPAVRPVGEGAS